MVPVTTTNCHEYSHTVIPSKQIPVQSYQYEYKQKVGNMVEVNNKDTRTTSILEKDVKYALSWQQRLQNNVKDTVLVSLLLTLNLFHTFLYFYCWLGTGNYFLGTLSKVFRVNFRSRQGTFKTKNGNISLKTSTKT